LELGYFIGKLSRSRVVVLRKDDVETPSDVLGVVYTSYDSAGAWKLGLAKEIEAAGYEVDWNRAMSAMNRPGNPGGYLVGVMQR